MRIISIGKTLFILSTFFLSAGLVYRGLPDQAMKLHFDLGSAYAPSSASTSQLTKIKSARAFYQHQFLPHVPTPSVHSATAVTLPDGRLISCWYGGTREGHQDVKIYCAYYGNETWSAPQVIMTREGTTQNVKTYTKKLGNPVLHFDKSTQTLWLFYVSTSFGGWSASSINVSVSKDMGASWSPTKRLISSPFLNISNLVKSPPIVLADGYLALPIYHELFTKFSELLVIAPDRLEVVYKSRISHKGSGIQPEVLVTDANHAIALIRNTSTDTKNKNHPLLSSTTEDGGLSWQPIKATNLPNPNAAVSGIEAAGIATDSLSWLLVFNNHASTRQNLSLAMSNDGRYWKTIYTFKEKAGEDFAYPWLLQDDQGIFHLLFTYNRLAIEHIRFNQAWVLEQQQASTNDHYNPN